MSRGGERRAGGVQLSVGEPGPGVEPEVDKHRAGVLAEEHRGPTYLQASVLITHSEGLSAVRPGKESYFEVNNGSTLQSQLAQSLVILQRFPLGLQSQFLPVDVGVFGFLPRDAFLQLPHGEGGENVGQRHHGLVGLGVNNLQLDVHVGMLLRSGHSSGNVKLEITWRSIVVTANLSEAGKFFNFCCIDWLTWILQRELLLTTGRWDLV